MVFFFVGPLLFGTTTILLAITVSDNDDNSVIRCCRRASPSSDSRDEASRIVRTCLLPDKEYGHRISLAGNNMPRDTVLAANDPILSETYGEFPLDSLDILLDTAMSHLMKNNHDDRRQRRLNVVDLGSGCGRLALYMSLSRPWDIHGIEISSTFHEQAMNAVHRGIEQGYYLLPCHDDDENNHEKDHDKNSDESVVSSSSKIRSSAAVEQDEDGGGCRLSLHLGSADDYQHLLQKADIIFCYSTAFDSSPTTQFSQTAQAMILSQYWNDLLTSNCRQHDDDSNTSTTPKTICITTDKALDPEYGWRILDRIDVANREVFGSTGYIQSLIV